MLYRNVVTFVFLIFLSCVSRANKIDSLKTLEDVEKFLYEDVNPDWKGKSFFTNYNFPDLDFNPYKFDTEEYNHNVFFKLDLDNNGSTDLVICGKYLFAITDEGGFKYKAHFIDGGAFMSAKYELINLLQEDRETLVVIRKFNENVQGVSDEKTDTLIMKFGDFMEYNRFPDNFIVESIGFSTSGCFGTCAVFNLAISKSRKIKYKAIKFNKQHGRYTSIINSTTFSNMIGAINYLKLKSLKESYSIGWTDDQSVTLEIRFNNGEVKKIYDYGKLGSFGLRNVYGQLLGYRNNLKWRRSIPF